MRSNDSAPSEGGRDGGKTIMMMDVVEVVMMEADGGDGGDATGGPCRTSITWISGRQPGMLG